MKNPHIRTELPGPRRARSSERDAAVVSPSYPREYPFVMSHGRGVEVWDVDGNRFLDFAAGIAVCSTGHCHPHVVASIKEAAERFLHISSDYWHEGQVRLGERIAAIAPVGEPAMTFFCQSGTESVEAARSSSRAPSPAPALHRLPGRLPRRTMGSLAFTSSKYTQQKGFFPTMPGVTLVPYPNPYRPLFAGRGPGLAVLDYIEHELFPRAVPPSEVAAVLVEPIQGEGGYLVPAAELPAGAARALRPPRDPADRGRGAVGHRPHRKMFACEHWGVTPDVLTLAKGLASGLPIGMVVAKKSVMERWPRGAHGNTFGGNPICCAAALATLDLVEGGYVKNADDVGRYFRRRLRELMERHASSARCAARE
jgi:4-aminobutyrate aminotransferase